MLNNAKEQKQTRGRLRDGSPASSGEHGTSITTDENTPHCATVGAADAIESANIVGYQTVTLKAHKMAMIGVPFTDVSSSAGISVQELVSTNGLTGAAGAANADQLWYYDPNENSGYIQLFLYDSTLTSSAALQRKGKWLCAVKPTDTSWGTGVNQISGKVLSP